MQVLQLPSAIAYVDRLRQDPAEAEALFRDLLIGVTQFFRDAKAFEALEREVIPRIVEQAGPDGTVRIWTPGCSTGEEAYSVAILVREEIQRREARPRVQIFAGDIDDEALEFARLARYPEGIAAHVAPARLERFFMKVDHSYQVSKEIREMCVFSTHNLIRDPPFSRLDLLVCRNVLIYLEGDLQRHLANLFHYALRPGGYLFLGPSESVVGPAGLFETLDKKQRLFVRSGAALAPAFSLAAPARGTGPDAGRLARTKAAERQRTVASLERLLLDHYAPAWVIINAQGEGVYFSPRTGRFLEPAVGAPSADVVGMARKGLRLDLRTAIHKAVKTGESVVHERVAVEAGGQVQTINLVVRPLTEGSEAGLYLVVFQEVGQPKSREDAEKEGGVPSVGDGVVQQLESELRTTKEQLRASLDEVETSNEELKSSNEELLSTNEELQSANEELQTSKEELQSVNEELETINAELNKKVEELDGANNDLQNLFQSTQIPTLFLDGSLRIKRFTEAATAVFRLIETDVGRPIMDIAPRFEGDILGDLRQVLRSLVPQERQVTLADGSASYLMRALPYRRPGNVIDGCVLTFLDVTPLKRALEQQARLAAVVESSQDAIVGRSFDGTILTWNAAAEKMFGYTAPEALGKAIGLIVPPDRMEQMELAHERIRRGEFVAPFETARVNREGRRLVVSVALSPIKDGSGAKIGVSGIFRDISEIKRIQEELRNDAAEKDRFLAVLSHELRNPLAPLRTSLEILTHFHGKAPETQQPLQVMHRQLSHLISLVDQLMEAARISSGKVALADAEIDLGELVRTEVGDQMGVFTNAGLAVKVDLPDAPVRVRGDRLRLAQVVDNLLTNAGKFTDSGGRVTISLRLDRNGKDARLCVADTGIGLEPGTEERLFRPFTQGATGPSRGQGLGLGLTLVRGLVASHGGRVEARSAGLGKGTEFIVRLPLAASEPALPAAPLQGKEPVAHPPRRVLLVEDNADASESLARLLALWGHKVEIAGDGRTAIEKAQTFRPEVVLCDLKLPGPLDGYGVARAFRSDSSLGSALLVALTGFGQPQDRERTSAAGFDQHLIKPANLDLLRGLLADGAGD